MRRTLWAALIAAFALGFPCLLWFIGGSRAAAREGEQLRSNATSEARVEAERLARRLAVRLESLRHSETRRSYRDYEAQGHDEALRCDCDRPDISPLAQGPADPLIWAHFQLDDVGQLTLPLGPESEDSTERTRAIRLLSDERAILELLECAAESRFAAADVRSADDRAAEVQSHDDEWRVTVGPFAWHNVTLASAPALLALREVVTPAAVLTQGFVIRREALESLLDDAPYPAHLQTGPPADEFGAGLPIDGPEWSVAVEASSLRREADIAADGVRRNFLISFALALSAAVVGGALVVGLVYQAERLAMARARFAAAAAHELRTPLTGLRIFGEMLNDESRTPEKRRHYARRIAGEVERLSRVVTNLLSFSNLERGRLRIQTSQAPLAAAVESSIDRLRPGIEAAGATIEAELPAEPLLARFDADALGQILQNLIDNAARLNRESDDRTIRVVVRCVAGRPELDVIDRGPGVHPSVRDRLFQPFTRHDSPEAGEGLGLGLALVRALVEAQGASVSHHDELGGGSRFTVRFASGG